MRQNLLITLLLMTITNLCLALCRYLPTSCDIRTWAAVNSLPMMVIGAEVTQLGPIHKGHSIPFSRAKVTFAD